MASSRFAEKLIFSLRQRVWKLHITPDEFGDRLHQAELQNGRSRVTPTLRENGVESLDLRLVNAETFEVIPDGLVNPYRPEVVIQLRGHIDIGPDGEPTVSLEGGADTSSVIRFLGTAAVLLFIAVYNLLILDPPNKLAYGLFVFVLVFLGWGLFQAWDLTDRVWSDAVNVVGGLVNEPRPRDRDT
jgi:hypothetical protein